MVPDISIADIIESLNEQLTLAGKFIFVGVYNVAETFQCPSELGIIKGGWIFMFDEQICPSSKPKGKHQSLALKLPWSNSVEPWS